MKFQKLYKIITEAKDEKPGMRYHSAKNSVGPAGIVSGPIGKSDNFEKRQPLKKWDFDLDKDSSILEDPKGKKWIVKNKNVAGAMLRNKRNILNNAFGLLRNDPNFEESVLEISKEFDQARENYRHYMLGEAPGTKKYDEENKLESLANSLQKSAGRIGSLIDIVVALQDKLKLAKYSKVDILNLQRDVDVIDIKLKDEASKIKSNKELYKRFKKEISNLEKIQGKIDAVKDKLSNIKSSMTSNKKSHVYDTNTIELGRLRLDKKAIEQELSKQKYVSIKSLYDRANKLKVDKKNKEQILQQISKMSPESIAHDRQQLEDQRAKLEAEKEKWKELAEDADNLNERVNQIGKVNFENNQAAIKKFLHQVVSSATKVLTKLDEKTPQTIKTLQDLDWEKVAERLDEKRSMLEILKVLDNNNPFIGYLDALYRRSYAVAEQEGEIFDPNTNTFRISTTQDDVPLVSLKELRPEEFNKNVNITSVRDFNSLPFVRLMNAFANSVKAPVSLQGTDLDVDEEQFKRSWQKLSKVFTDRQFRSLQNPEAIQWQSRQWDREDFKQYLRQLIMNLGMSETDINSAFALLARPFGMTKRGLNSFGQLWSNLQSSTKRVRENIYGPTGGPVEITESFDQLYNKIIKRTQYDKDLMKIGLMEILK